VAAYAIQLCELLATLEDEITFIWRSVCLLGGAYPPYSRESYHFSKPWTWIDLDYVFVRYGSLVYMTCVNSELPEPLKAPYIPFSFFQQRINQPTYP
jgi:hypothetical protein